MSEAWQPRSENATLFMLTRHVSRAPTCGRVNAVDAPSTSRESSRRDGSAVEAESPLIAIQVSIDFLFGLQPVLDLVSAPEPATLGTSISCLPNHLPASSISFRPAFVRAQVQPHAVGLCRHGALLVDREYRTDVRMPPLRRIGYKD